MEDFLNTFLPPVYNGGFGVRLPWGHFAQPGSRIAAYVHSDGASYEGADTDVNGPIVTTLNAALAMCRSGKGDVVAVLPGHAESFSGTDVLDNLVAGTDIVCLGHGTMLPTFTWTGATDQLKFDVADVRWFGGKLELAGDPSSTTALTVAQAIAVSAAGCGIYGSKIDFGVDADQKVTLGIATTAAADDFAFMGNHCYGATAAECTTFLRLIGADRAKIVGNNIQGATSSATVGLIQFLTTASTFVIFENNRVVNNKAASVHAVTGMAGLTGLSWGNGYAILDNTTTAGFETEGSMQFLNDHVSNDAGAASVAKTPT